MRPAILMLVLTSALVTAGCGAVPHLAADGGDPAQGKVLFKANCSSCHSLANADATGKIGPNLDDAFRYVKLQGFDQSTIRDVVRAQIAYSIADPRTGFPGMPPNIVTGQQARDVAIYVAECSAKPDCVVTAAAG